MSPRNTNRPAVTVLSVGLHGLDAELIHVEAVVGDQPGQFQHEGLPENRARETRVRVRAALQQSWLDLHERPITVTFQPLELAMNTVLDLAVAVAVLVAVGRVPVETVNGSIFLGELSLTGALRPVRGVLPILRGAMALGVRSAVVPRANAHEAALVAGIEVLIADHLLQVVEHLQPGRRLEAVHPTMTLEPDLGAPDLSEVRGQEAARRTLEIAAAGHHSLWLTGSRGSGKTTLARRLTTILPPLSIDEALEVTSISSVAGVLQPEQGLISSRPFRAPHPTVSSIGLLGGGDPIRPGEVSLAHHGVLFLDDLQEFRRTNLEGLHRILDAGQAEIHRARRRVTFPARPLLVGATSSCPCGFLGTSHCSCSPERINVYRARLNGAFFDSFDLRIVLPIVDLAQLQREPSGESPGVVRERVVRARARKAERESAKGTISSRSSRPHEALKLDAQGSKVLAEAVERLQLSAVERHRVLRVARTIADLEGSEMVRARHVAEAISYLHRPST